MVTRREERICEIPPHRGISWESRRVQEKIRDRRGESCNRVQEGKKKLGGGGTV